MRDNAGVSPFVGRADALERLATAYQAVAGAAGGVPPRRAGLVLVTGEAGMGKTALLARFAAEVTARGGWPVWGTCWDGENAPAFWPWTQALRALIDQWPELREAAGPELVAMLPELAPVEPSTAGDSDAVGRLRMFDAAGRFLRRASTTIPVVVILDDLQWSDQSTVDLMRFLTSQAQPGALLLAGAYRPGEPGAEVAAALAGMATTAELVALRGLAAEETAELVDALAGGKAAARWAHVVHDRSGGHPFFAREVWRLLAAGSAATAVPVAVRDVIGRRVARLSARCVELLDVAAVAGTQLLPDVLADVSGDDLIRVAELLAEAAGAGILTPVSDQAEGTRFAHDLYRESIYAALPPGRRVDLHGRVAAALVRRHERGSPVFAAELARHFAAAVPVAGAAPAVAWARAAAEADATRFAFAEAAGHLARSRSAVADAGDRLPDPDLVDLLTAEADLRLRSGDATQARALLDIAWTRAVAAADPALIGMVALGLDRVGARFAMPRTDLIDVLDTARHALTGSATPAEAQVTAALARHLQHSVPSDRPRARPLAEQAATIARTLDDPGTLASCLLAYHDTLWTPGTATQRESIAGEIADLAQRAADPERHAQALLLTATAQLENGSPAFRVTLAEYGYLTERLRQPRHHYLLRTRQAALALLDGDIDTGEGLSAEAAAVGEAVGDTDTGNVRMSQRLEVTRARNDPTELRDTAYEAVRWWIGAPAHAHAVAAGFYARAGDVDAARRELDTVLALPDWRTDRSYLWSIFVGELTAAATALDDRPVCQQLLDDLLPIADTCAVNGALVCFMGAHAHRVGLLHAALGQPAPARQWLLRALDVHRRLGAALWEAETCTALAGLGGTDMQPYAGRASTIRTRLGLAVSPAEPAGTNGQLAQLERVGDIWQARFRGHTAYLRDAKGLHDLATLLARPGVEVAALDLADTVMRAAAVDSAGGDAVLDRAALAAYRRRLTELDDELDAAHTMSDLALRERAAGEREQVLAELRRATRPDGASRPLGPTAAERARKAVTARIRDAIRRIADVHPDLGTHLDRTIHTGATCRYEPGL